MQTLPLGETLCPTLLVVIVVVGLLSFSYIIADVTICKQLKRLRCDNIQFIVYYSAISIQLPSGAPIHLPQNALQPFMPSNLPHSLSLSLCMRQLVKTFGLSADIFIAFLIFFILFYFFAWKLEEMPRFCCANWTVVGEQWQSQCHSYIA